MPKRQPGPLDKPARAWPKIDKLTKAAALVVALGAGGGVFYQFSPFAWAWEFRDVAATTYSSAVGELRRTLIWLDEQIAEARKKGEKDKVRRLLEQRGKLQDEFDKTKTKRDKFQ